MTSTSKSGTFSVGIPNRIWTLPWKNMAKCGSEFAWRTTSPWRFPALEANWQERDSGQQFDSEDTCDVGNHREARAGFQQNWRTQMYLFRARFDANVQAEARAQKHHEDEAYAALSQAPDVGVAKAIQQARTALAKADKPAAPEIRSGIEARTTAAEEYRLPAQRRRPISCKES